MRLKALNKYLLIAVVLLTACSSRHTNEEQAIRTMCAEIAAHYPAATLQDVYKTCYQDRFGSEHLISDTAVAHRFLREEIASCTTHDLNAMPLYEPTGFRHRFVRANLALIRNGQMTEEELFDGFVKTANERDTCFGEWEAEWSRIEQIALSVHPQWADEALQAELRYAAQLRRAVRHSDSFRNAYFPHYRIIRNNEPL